MRSLQVDRPKSGQFGYRESFLLRKIHKGQEASFFIPALPKNCHFSETLSLSISRRHSRYSRDRKAPADLKHPFQSKTLCVSFSGLSCTILYLLIEFNEFFLSERVASRVKDLFLNIRLAMMQTGSPDSFSIYPHCCTWTGHTKVRNR